MNEMNQFNAKVLVAGCACVIFSALTPDEIRRLQRLHPEALKLVDEGTKETLFRIEMTEEGQPGDIEDQFARFSSTTDVKGKATITIVLDPSAEDKPGLVRDKLGKAIQNLIRTESQALKVLPKLEEEEKEITGQIACL